MSLCTVCMNGCLCKSMLSSCNELIRLWIRLQSWSETVISSRAARSLTKTRSFHCMLRMCVLNERMAVSWMHVGMTVCMCLYVFVFKRACVRVCVCARVFVGRYVHVFVCIWMKGMIACIRVLMLVCMYMCVSVWHVCTCTYIHMNVCMNGCLCVRAKIYVWAWVCICIYIRMYVVYVLTLDTMAPLIGLCLWTCRELGAVSMSLLKYSSRALIFSGQVRKCFSMRCLCSSEDLNKQVWYSFSLIHASFTAQVILLSMTFVTKSPLPFIWTTLDLHLCMACIHMCMWVRVLGQMYTSVNDDLTCQARSVWRHTQSCIWWKSDHLRIESHLDSYPGRNIGRWEESEHRWVDMQPWCWSSELMYAW